MFEQAFKNIDNALRQDAGCTTELDYTEQTSWVLFLERRASARRSQGFSQRCKRKQALTWLSRSQGRYGRPLQAALRIGLRSVEIGGRLLTA